MLDSRTSLPTEGAQRAAVHAKGAGLLEALNARPSQPDGLSFGSVLSSTLSDRRATPASRSRAVADPASSPVRSRQASRRKAAAKDGAAGDGPADAAAQDASQRTDPPQSQDSTPAAPEAGTADAPQASDGSPTDGSQSPADAATESTRQATQVAATGAAGASSSANIVDPTRLAAGADGGAAMGAAPPAKVDVPGLTPLQWMAQQQVARLNARTEQVRASIPVLPADAKGPSSAPGAAAATPQASALVPAAQQVLAERVASAASSALDLLKVPQGGTDGLTPGDPATDTTHKPATQLHSATADPIGLLNAPEGSTSAAASSSQASPAPAHAPASSPAGAPPHVALPPTADDHAVQNMQRLAAMVHAKAGQGNSVARMQLQPPELGAVTAVVLLRQGKMDLRLEVANEAARDLVTDGLGRLRDSLQQQGISLDRATVNVAPRSENAHGDQQQPAWSGSQDNNSSGQFHSGQGQPHGDRDFATSFAMDVPAAAGDGAGDVPAGVVYAAGLNVLA